MAIQQPNNYDQTTMQKKGIIDKLSWIKTVVTPIWDVATRIDINSTTFYWNYVSVTVPSATDAKSYGVALTGANPETENQFTQYVEQNAKAWDINNATEAVAKAGGLVGRTSEDVRLEKERREQLKYADEWSFLNGAGAAGDNTPTAATMKGLIVIGASGVATTGVLSTWSTTTGEDDMNTHLIAIRAAGGLMGARKLIYSSHSTKQLMNKWKGIASAVNTMAEDKKIYSDVKIWDTESLGAVQLEAHDLCPAADILTLNPDELEICVLEETRKGDNGSVFLSKKSAVGNLMSIKYGPVASLGLMVVSG